METGQGDDMEHILSGMISCHERAQNGSKVSSKQ